jgi:hypothetical protein
MISVSLFNKHSSYESMYSQPWETDAMSGQLHAPNTIPQGKSSKYPLYTRSAGHQSQLDAVAKRKISAPTMN